MVVLTKIVAASIVIELRMSSKKKSLDLYLTEAYRQFIAIKDDDCKLSQEVFKNVFETVKQKMSEQCNYFKKYSSQVTYAGSVADGIKVSKMNEFDVVIVIRLPINYDHGENGIIIEHEQPGFVKLKIANAFDNLDKQQDWEKCHKITRDWRDSDKYLLQNKFRQWLHGIVQKALNSMEGTVTVFDEVYQVTYKESGPAYTLNIRNDKGNKDFLLDVDLVPVIKFMFPRTPEGYRTVEGVKAKEWFVVPKPNKEFTDTVKKNRCWRVSFQQQERDVIKNCKAMKMTIRLLKKLRDSLEMKYIVSYYIKTLFLWKIEETKEDKTFWQKKLSELFRIMVNELYVAIENKSIRFFWNKCHNLIGSMKPSLQKIYMDKLKEVLANIETNNVDKVISFLLPVNEFKEFKNSDFYLKQIEGSNDNSQQTVVNMPKIEKILSQDITVLNSELNGLRNSVPDEKILELEHKINDLLERVSFIEDRLKKLEMEKNGKFHGVIGGANTALSEVCEDLSSSSLDVDFSLINFDGTETQMSSKIITN